MILKFDKKAKEIARKGDQFIEKYGQKDFHKKASELLEAASFQDLYNFEDIVGQFFQPKAIERQNFKQLEFSDLPLTLARGSHCFIDLYFWRRRPTVIHNHHFSGAFTCLIGNNVDHEFSFKKGKKIGKAHELGLLQLESKRVLRPGDIAAIAPLNKFIHQNHHQADLTVNLCFRTPDFSKNNLSNYLYSGLRYEKNPHLLARAVYLRKFIDTGRFDCDKLNLTIDDAAAFLIQNYGSPSGNPLLQKVLKTLSKRLKDEAGVDIGKMIDDHDRQMEQFENDYE